MAKSRSSRDRAIPALKSLANPKCRSIFLLSRYPRERYRPIVGLAGPEKQVKNHEVEVSFAWSDPNTVSLLNSETTDLDVTVTELYTDYVTISRQFLRGDNKLLLVSTFRCPSNSS